MEIYRMKNATLLEARAVQDLAEKRLQPPDGLPAEQRIVWHQTVDSLPSDWFACEQTPLLTAFCNHAVRLAKVEAALLNLDPTTDLETFDKLSRLAANESTKLLAHGRSMRLTQQSRLKSETAHGRAGAAAHAAAMQFDDFDELLARHPN
jgi:hypothetical protein